MIILIMPVYNEADGIEEFIIELDRALPPGVLVQVVDDAPCESAQATRPRGHRGTRLVSRSTGRSGDGHNVGITTSLDTNWAVRPVLLACLSAVMDGFCIVTGHNPLSATY